MQVLTLMLVVANLANTKCGKKLKIYCNPGGLGTHLRVISESYPKNTNMTGFRFFWTTKVAMALKGLNAGVVFIAMTISN